MKITIISLLFLFISCSSDDNGSTVRIGQGLDSSNIAGGAVIYASNIGTGEERTYVFQTGTELENAVMNFPNNSTWDFRVVTWEGINGNFTGTIRCGLTIGLFIGEGNANLDVDLTNSNCFENNITVDGGIPAINNGNFDEFAPMALLGCGTFDYGGGTTITDSIDALSCFSDPYFEGISTEYTISIQALNSAGVGQSELRSDQCFKAYGDTISLNIPVGFDLGPGFKFILEAYENHRDDFYATGGCDDDGRALFMDNGWAGSEMILNDIYPVASFPAFYDSGYEELQLGFADNIAGVGTSPLTHLMQAFECGATSGDCMPQNDALDDVGIEYVIPMTAPASFTPLFVNEGYPCFGAATLDAFTETGGGTAWGPVPATNPAPVNSLNLGDCSFLIDSKSQSSFSQGGRHFTFDYTDDSLSDNGNLVWVTEHEVEVRRQLFNSFGSSSLFDLVGMYDGNETMDNPGLYQSFDPGVPLDIIRFLGAHTIGGLLSAGYPNASVCSDLPNGTSRDFQYDFGDGLEGVTIAVDDATSKVIPNFICDASDGYGSSCGGETFDKKISLSDQGGLREVYYIHCTRKLGMGYEHEVDGDDYDKRMKLWNLENDTHFRFESYEEHKEEDKVYARYSRVYKPNDVGKYYFWSIEVDKNIVTGVVNHAGQTAVHSSAVPPSNYFTNFKHRSFDSSNFGTYAWTTMAASDGFYSVVATDTCLNSSTMADGSAACTGFTILNAIGGAGVDYSTGATLADPYLGIQPSLDMEAISNNGFPFGSISSF